ncbi:hypothetical protein ACQP3D_28110 [Escherichia coli]
MTGLWHGPDPVLAWARGSACFSSGSARIGVDSRKTDEMVQQIR